MYAIDYQTGKVRWTRDMSGSRGGFAGTLATAGHLVFTANDSGMLMALDPATGKTLWHTYGGGGSTTSPMTYELDGHRTAWCTPGRCPLTELAEATAELPNFRSRVESCRTFAIIIRGTLQLHLTQGDVKSYELDR